MGTFESPGLGQKPAGQGLVLTAIWLSSNGTINGNLRFIYFFFPHLLLFIPLVIMREGKCNIERIGKIGIDIV